MTMPIINYKATGMELDQELQTLLEAKFTSLEKYIGDETDVKCEVEFRKSAPQQNGKICAVEANIWLKGTMYRAEAAEDQFEKAIDEVREELDKELRRASKKSQSLIKRGGRKLKEMMRFGA
ncbi:MAG TPA: ribosome-associated translation inhibitor RaiA [Candidatus Paceibacterota bacterium]|nr:ribosome-associated translation inhibitor RaiA [Candidatus Paceibacterota bacterium]